MLTKVDLALVSVIIVLLIVTWYFATHRKEKFTNDEKLEYHLNIIKKLREEMDPETLSKLDKEYPHCKGDPRCFEATQKLIQDINRKYPNCKGDLKCIDVMKRADAFEKITQDKENNYQTICKGDLKCIDVMKRADAFMDQNRTR